jgi:hypothetical protein
VDPVTLAAIRAGVGAASGKLVEGAWDAGEKWLTSYYKDHEQKALEQAKSNSMEFLADLAQGVGRIEDEAGNQEATKRQIESALGDPDFSAMLKEAIFTSARTSNGGKHTLLARIVAERLRVSSGGLLAVTSNMACDIVGNLTPKQIPYLVLATIVLSTRPDDPFPQVRCHRTNSGRSTQSG